MLISTMGCGPPMPLDPRGAAAAGAGSDGSDEGGDAAQAGAAQGGQAGGGGAGEAGAGSGQGGRAGEGGEGAGAAGAGTGQGGQAGEGGEGAGGAPGSPGLCPFQPGPSSVCASPKTVWEYYKCAPAWYEARVAIGPGGDVWLAGSMPYMPPPPGVAWELGEWGITRMASPGSFLWARYFGDEWDPDQKKTFVQRAADFVVDDQGNAVLVGRFDGTLVIENAEIPSAGGLDAFALSYGPGGLLRWVKRFGGAGDQRAERVALSSSGHAVVLGTFEDGIDFGNVALAGQAPSNVFAAELDADGQVVWSKRIGSGLNVTVAGLAVDGFDHMVIAGSFDGSAELGGAPLKASDADVFVAKLQTDGTHLWSKSFGEAGLQAAIDVATGGADDIYLVGDFTGSVDFGCGPLLSAGARDVFVTRLSPSGAAVWSRRFGGSDDDEAQQVGADAAGRVLWRALLGQDWNNPPADLGCGAPNAENVVVALDANGQHIWTQATGPVDNVHAYYFMGMAVSPSGRVAIARSVYHHDLGLKVLDP
ncbi:MAG: hypothetical protein HY744_01620 [Deltaproteobacteria bacterium]|nr:hypothetical protein [Deltaproteobacteria bacterium]